MLRIGVDIGGTKIELAVLAADGSEVLRRRAPTPHGNYDAALHSLAGLVRDAERSLGVRACVGVGLPGTIVPRTGLVANAFATPYNGRPLKADLAGLLEREVRFANDANCFALSEALDGAASGVPLVFGATLGTGAGGGIVLEGRILPSLNGIGGEWGHNPLPWMGPQESPGPACYCGRSGCIERFVSGTGIADDHARIEGVRLDPAVIASRAETGDAACERTIARFEDRLARSLAHVINLLDPGVIVLGGSVSALLRLYANVPRLWRSYAYSAEVDTGLVPARHGGASGVRGAARLWDA